MKKVLILAAVCLLLLPGLTMMAASAGFSDILKQASGASAAPHIESIPPGMLTLYERASATCPGMSWTVLAAIGTVESSNGTSNLPGVHSGRNGAGAEGPMQFEPGTFAEYGRPVPSGGASPPSPYDPADAVYAAARMLCAQGGGLPSKLGQAIYQYNHSGAYVAAVLSQAESYGFGDSAVGGSDAGARAAEYAVAQIGTPYRWGGESPGTGFDCSGLVQAAWATAGVLLPRVAQEQFEAGPDVPRGDPLQPGDLVFFGSAPGAVTHVGLVVDPSGLMVDAPHTGAYVRAESFPRLIGAGWGEELFLGATRPGG